MFWRALPSALAHTALCPCLRAELWHGRGNACAQLHAGRGGRAKDTVDGLVLERERRAIPPPDTNARTRTFMFCGRILPGHAIEMRDETGRVLPDRRVGRIFVRGPSLMSGYFGAPEENARAMGDDGWLDTGDLGYLVDGQIVITGRVKDLMIVNGRNVWPQDLEWAAESEIASLRSGDIAVFSVDWRGR